MSAKAANRLGISFSVLTTASAVHSRDKGVMAPAQSPGILVWPTNYIPMSPTEVEMHSCKYLQTLLGCRHALHEYITSVEVDGQKLATDQDFEDTIWEYEWYVLRGPVSRAELTLFVIASGGLAFIGRLAVTSCSTNKGSPSHLPQPIFRKAMP